MEIWFATSSILSANKFPNVKKRLDIKVIRAAKNILIDNDSRQDVKDALYGLPRQRIDLRMVSIIQPLTSR